MLSTVLYTLQLVACVRTLNKAVELCVSVCVWAFATAVLTSLTLSVYDIGVWTSSCNRLVVACSEVRAHAFIHMSASLF